VTATGTGTTYRVLAGDSLWSIARQSIGPSATIATIDTTWHQIYDANRAAIGGNPSVLHVGIVLRVPSAR
jgi:nucleoid-associated protein YgaU